jgi:hypothetical protein
MWRRLTPSSENVGCAQAYRVRSGSDSQKSLTPDGATPLVGIIEQVLFNLTREMRMRSTGLGMASRLFAVWLIGLIALPCTAPFAAFDGVEFLRHSNTCCEAPVLDQGVHAGQEHAAVSRNRSDLLTRLRPRSFVATPYYDATAVLGVFRSSLAPTFSPIDRPASLRTVLRI